MSEFPEETAAAIGKLFLVMKTAGTHGVDHPSTLQAAEAARTALQQARPPFALQFIGAATFRDQELVVLDHEDFQKSRQLGKGLAGFDAQELSVDALPRAEGLAQLGDLVDICDLCGQESV